MSRGDLSLKHKILVGVWILYCTRSRGRKDWQLQLQDLDNFLIRKT